MKKTENTPLDLARCPPDRLVDKIGLDKLLEAIHAVPRWDPERLRILDYVYRERLLALLGPGGGEPGLRALSDHLTRVLSPRTRRALAEGGGEYPARWEGYRDLVEARLAALRSDAPRSLAERPRFREILDRIAEGVDSQAELVRRTGRSKSEVSQILAHLVRCELVERHRVGRENRVRLGSRAVALGLGARPVAGRAAASTPRWGSYL